MRPETLVKMSLSFYSYMFVYYYYYYIHVCLFKMSLSEIHIAVCKRKLSFMLKKDLLVKVNLPTSKNIILHIFFFSL